MVDKKEVDIDLKEKCIELEKKVKDKIQEHPIISVGIGLGLGLCTGYILGKVIKCHQD